MRASHKKRIGRLIETLEEPERAVFEERCMRRFVAFVCEDIRLAMEWRGLDPGSSPALRDAETRVGRFVDTPDQRAADWAVLEAEREHSVAAGDDPWAELSDD